MGTKLQKRGTDGICRRRDVPSLCTSLSRKLSENAPFVSVFSYNCFKEIKAMPVLAAILPKTQTRRLSWLPISISISVSLVWAALLSLLFGVQAATGASSSSGGLILIPGLGRVCACVQCTSPCCTHVYVYVSSRLYEPSP